MSEIARDDILPEITRNDVYYLCKLYGYNASDIIDIKDLPSYDDKVFHIIIDKNAGKPSIVMKCSIQMEFNRIDLQIELMKRFQKYNVPSPKAIKLLDQYVTSRNNTNEYIYVTKDFPSINDECYPNIIKESKIKHKYNTHVHCMTFVDGKLVNEVKNTNNNMRFYKHLGNILGQMSNSLKGFTHDASTYEHLWDLGQIDLIKPYFKCITDENKMKLTKHYWDMYNKYIRPNLNRLPKSIIHGDLNDCNLLCDADTLNITAVFDFGDVKYTNTIFDIAIALAYFMMNKNKEDALNCLFTIIKGYHAKFPLTKDEINVLFVAIMARLLQSTSRSAYKVALTPENKEYLEIHAKPGWKLMEIFYDTKPEDISQMILKAINPSKL
mmetsp:Transcript_14774/g.18146  ORF Transcript_14774/g.18146 Transcript_14774/m.18146 type:complete len:382 (-) Transcript_14774:56-1201(-)